MKRLCLLVIVLAIAISTQAQALPLPSRFEFPSGYALNLPDTWDVELDADGYYLISEDTIIYLIDDLPSYYSLQEIMDINGEGYFDSYQVRHYNLPDGRRAARAEYVDDYGDEAVDIVVEATDGSHGYFIGLTFEGELTEYDTIMAIASSYDIAANVGGTNVEAFDTSLLPDVTFNTDRITVPDWRDRYSSDVYVAAQCPFYILPPEREGQTVECGYLFVPENRANSVNNIQLLVMQIRKLNNTSQAAPVIYLEGGPGGSAVSGYQFWYASALRDDHDIILLEQRGTGFSLPSLDCYEYYENTSTPAADCAQRLRDAGIDLGAYNSAENAADVAALIQALDLPEVNLYGASYGTRLALTVLRDHPQNIRSVILESVYPPNVQGYEEQALNAYYAFETLLNNCLLDADCNTAYPTLRSSFYGAIRDLNDNPLEVYDWYYEEYFDLTGDDLVNDVFFAMYSAYDVPYLPTLIDAAARRDAETYSDFMPIYGDFGFTEDAYSDSFIKAAMDLLGIQDFDEVQNYLATVDVDTLYDIESYIYGYIDDDSEGMYNSVRCTDEVPFNTGEGYKLASETIPDLIRDAIATGVDLQYVDCAAWDVPSAPQIENEAVFGDVPVLLVSGEYDPITPYSWANVAAETLPNSYNYFYPAMAHGAIDIDPCPTQMALDFLTNPTIAPDDSCIANMETEFYIP